MSVINRMLADLEQRGAPAARGPDALAASGDRRRRRPAAAMRRLLPAALALALVVVAAVLWLQRGPELLARLTAAGPSVPVADGSDADDAAAAPADRTGAEATAPPALVGLEFSGEGDDARLALVFDGPPDGHARYLRSGAQLSLQVAARLDEATVPAPPGGQSVFRALAVEEASDRGSTMVRLDVAADARFEVLDEGERLVLVGERPAEVKRLAAPLPSSAPVAGAAAVGDDVAAGETRAQGAAGDDVPDATDTGAQGAAEDDDPDAGDTRAQGAAADDAPDAGETRAQGAAGDDAPDAGDARAQGAAADDAPDAADTRAQGAAEDDEPGGGAAAAPQEEGSRAGAVRKSARTSPEVRAQRRYRAARTALSEGSLTVARGRLREALEADPDLHGARELLAALLRRAGHAPAARKVLAQGVERAPGRPGFAKPYARLLVDSGELEQAAEVLEHAAAAATGDAGYHALVAAIAQRLERHERAATAYTRALEIEAGNGRWWLGLGISLAETGYAGEARAAFRKARATDDLTPRLDSWARGRIEALGDDGEQ